LNCREEQSQIPGGCRLLRDETDTTVAVLKGKMEDPLMFKNCRDADQE